MTQQPAPGAPSSPAAFVGLLWLAFLAGTALRLVQYLARRSLWLDECMLALNVVARTFSQLLLPLDYNQTAPPLFLWTERAAVSLCGVDELVLRAFPMTAGIVLVLWIGLVARRIAGDAAGLLAAALAALSPALIRYANEAKPYGSDALATLALVHAALLARSGGRRAWLRLLAVGLGSLLVSLPAVFVATGVTAALLLDRALAGSQGRGRALAAALSCGGAWALAAAALYFAVYRQVAKNPFQQDAYAYAFLTPGPNFLARLDLALRGTLLPTFLGSGSAVPSVPSWVPWLTAFVLGTGLLVVRRRAGTGAAALLVMPLLAATGASALCRYPLGVPRMMVFASPLLLLAAGAALGAAADGLGSRVPRPLLTLAGAACLVPMAFERVAEARSPFRGEDAATLVAAFREQRPRREEPVYVGARGLASWLFYTTNWSSPSRERLAFYARAASSGPSFENAPSRGRAVVDEGLDLVVQYRHRREILGVASGRQWRWPEYATEDVDAGWASNEAERIAREAEPCAWLYFTRMSERSYKPLVWELRGRYQAREVFLTTAPGGLLARYCAEMREWQAGLLDREREKARQRPVARISP